MMVQNYDDFVQVLLKNGFSMGGGNDEGIYAVIPFSWNEETLEDTPIKWQAIKNQVLKINPTADPKKINKFIKG